MYETKISVLIPFLILYLFISFFLFLYTTSGWIGFTVFMYGAPIIFVLIMFLIIILVNAAHKGKYFTFISTKLLYSLLALQFVYITFSVGDAGDASGSYVFIARYLEVLDSRDMSSSGSALYGLIESFAIIIYLGCILKIIFEINKNKHEGNTLNNAPTVLSSTQNLPPALV